MHFPLSVLRMSILPYRCGRTLCTGKLCALPIFPTQGLGVGSHFANVELALYMACNLRMIMASHPQVSIDAFVDDISIQASHRDPAVLAHLVVDDVETLSLHPQRQHSFHPLPLPPAWSLQAWASMQGFWSTPHRGWEWNAQSTKRSTSKGGS